MTLEQLQEISTERTEQLIGAWNWDKDGNPIPIGLSEKIVEQYKKAYLDINKQLKAIEKKIATVKPENYYNEVVKHGRLSALKSQIAATYNQAAGRAGVLQVESATLAISNKYYENMYAVNWFSADAFKGVTDFQYFAVLNTKTIQSSVLGTPKVWNSLSKAQKKALKPLFPKHGTLIKTLNDNRVKDLLKLQEVITQGLLKGKSSVKTAKDLQKVFTDIAGDVKERMEVSASNALRIARTEGARNMNSGAYANTQEAIAAGLELKRKAIETLDTRTRSQSHFIDDEEVEGDEPFNYPGGLKVMIIGNSGVARFDINERGRSIDVVPGTPAGKRTGRDPATGKIETASYKNLDQWMKSHNLKYNKSGRMVSSKGITKPLPTKGFIPAKSVSEAVTRLGNYADNVLLPDTGLNELNSILHGAEDVLGKNNIKIEELRYFPSRRSIDYGTSFSPSGKAGSYIRLNRGFIENANAMNKTDAISFKVRTDGYKARLEDRINETLETHTKREISLAKKELINVEATKSYLLQETMDDPIYSLMTHESYHQVQRQNRLLWPEEFKNINKIDKLSVSEYAASAEGELFAEIGLAITRGVEVPQNLKEMFNEMIGGIK